MPQDNGVDLLNISKQEHETIVICLEARKSYLLADNREGQFSEELATIEGLLVSLNDIKE